MKNKKVITCLVAAGLVACIGAGSTLAYLQDETDVIKNTFTIGDVKIDLDEPEWNPVNAEDMLPGASVDKNPLVTNVGQTDAFIGIRLDGVKELVEKGFLIKSDSNDAVLDAVDSNADEKVFEAAETSKVFAWNHDFTLVDAEGNKLDQGADNVLTLSEIKELCGTDDVLYFAYETVVAPGAQTKTLFDEVKLDADVIGAPSSYTIVKHFVDADDEILTEDADTHVLSGVPAKNADGEYIYKYTVTELGTTVYDSYDTAKAAIDAAEAADTTDTYRFDMDIKAAAIQSVNDENDDWTVGNTSVWYPVLPEEF